MKRATDKENILLGHIDIFLILFVLDIYLIPTVALIHTLMFNPRELRPEQFHFNPLSASVVFI